ncbi:hypothetical protein KEM56_007735 [Ascosphaera pollenicola]|nr:hypothetical protein KEM56_007735 [Ascosphaera pollenicola]
MASHALLKSIPKASLKQASCLSVRHYTNPALSTSLQMDIPDRKLKYIPKSGTYPLGFKVSAVHAGVKASNKNGYPDIALITSVAETPCTAAAVFTTNKFQAAPVQVSREILETKVGKGVKSVIINAGCANAVTGRKGIEDAKSMVKKVDELAGSEGNASNASDSSLVMSTGVIGQLLPMQKILDAIPKAHSNLSSSHASWLLTARAICTTDTFPKLISRTFTLPSSPDVTYRIAGMTKGAGMIHPNMATLLGVICTDAPIAASAMKPLLVHAVNRSFNSISIDGDTSTNDTIALLANGAAGGKTVSAADVADADYAALQEVVTSFAQSLSQLVVRDGEGATKFVTVRVKNSPSHADARQIASTLARSPLVKTALYGKDANWGRILCAVGYTPGISPETVVPEKTSVSFVPADGSAELKLLVNGEPENVDEERAAAILQDEDLEIVIDLGGGEKGEEGKGGEEGIYWFCDFSHEYVTINGDYRT